MGTFPRTRSLQAAALVVLSSAGLISSATPAFATALSITSLSCESRPVGYLCDGWATGGTGVYTSSWSKATRTRSDYATGSVITVSCPVGSSSGGITFTVRDSAAATVSQTAASVPCGGNP
jgi:hypothetical protein